MKLNFSNLVYFDKIKKDYLLILNQPSLFWISSIYIEDPKT